MRGCSRSAARARAGSTGCGPRRSRSCATSSARSGTRGSARSSARSSAALERGVAGAEPIVREVWIDAAPDEVFRYFTQKDLYLRLMGLAAELDPRPGGVFRVDPNGRDEIVGEFVELVPPRRLVLSWGYAAP